MKSKRTNIVTLAGEFESAVKLKNYCDAQYSTLISLKQELDKIKSENEHLKSLLNGVIPSSAAISRDLPVKEKPLEQTICELELDKMHKLSIDRPLTLDETRKLEILMKNLSRLRGDGSENNLIDDYSDDELMVIAKNDGSTKS